MADMQEQIGLLLPTRAEIIQQALEAAQSIQDEQAKFSALVYGPKVAVAARKQRSSCSQTRRF